MDDRSMSLRLAAALVVVLAAPLLPPPAARGILRAVAAVDVAVVGGMVRMVGCCWVVVEDLDGEVDAFAAEAVETDDDVVWDVGRFFRLMVSDWSPYGDGALKTIGTFLVLVALLVLWRLLIAVPSTE